MQTWRFILKSLFLVLLGLILFLNSRVAFSQDDKLDEAGASSNSLNNPVRRGIDAVGIVGGPLIFFSSYRVPQTEELIAAQKRVHDLRAELYQEAPEITRLRNEAVRIQNLRTVEETRNEVAALEGTLRQFNQLSGKYALVANTENKVFSSEGLEQLRNAETTLLGDLANYKKELIPQSAKNEMLRSTQKEMKGAEQAAKIAQRRVQDQLSSAVFDLKRTRSRVLAEEVKAPWARRIGGAIIFIAGAGDVFYAWKDTMSGATVATPEDLGKVAELISTPAEVRRVVQVLSGLKNRAPNE